MKILGFLPDPGGCGFYRMRQPLEWMKYDGHEVRYFTPMDLMGITPERTGLLRWTDAVLCQRLVSVDLMEMLRDYCPDAVLAYDLDDFYWNLPYENQARISINEAKLKELARAMAKADVVIASTPYLQELLGRFHPRVELVRNALDPTWIRESRPENPCLRIGWAGSITHRVDLEPMIAGLRMAMNEMPDLAAVFMGADAAALARQLPHDRTFYHDPVQIDHYLTVLGRINLDIGLAPIREHEFNRAKSEVKWLEYTAVGAAVVASNVGPYQENIEHEKTGLLVRHHVPYEWRDAIIRLAQDRELREEMVRNARQDVLIRNNAQKWAGTLGEILERGAMGHDGPVKLQPEVMEELPSSASGWKTEEASCPPAITVAVLNWVPEPGPRMDTMIECLPRILARCWELGGEAVVEVVIRDQGSCAEATLWLLQEVLYWRARGLRIAVEDSFENRGIKVLNEVRQGHPADFLLKIDNDVMIPPLGLVKLLRTWREMDSRWKVGMLGLDVAWMNGETFATRDHGKCVEDEAVVSEGRVFIMKPGSVVIGQCRLERMDRLEEVGGYPERMYGTDQPNADAYSRAEFINAHLLPFEAAAGEIRPRPMVHHGVEETEEVMAYKRAELRQAVGS